MAEGGSAIVDDASEKGFSELLQLHRSAVQQSDTDLSDLFEIRLRAYCEQLIDGPHDSAPLSENVMILGFAAMHGLVAPRRQQWEGSRKFNRSLVGFVHSVLAESARRQAAAQGAVRDRRRVTFRFD